MVVILGLFYFAQDQHLLGESAVMYAVDNTIDWLLDVGYTTSPAEAAGRSEYIRKLFRF